jgi:hypothetical protein
MPDIPFSLASDNESEFLDNTMRIFRDVYDNIGGAAVGDVFYSDADTLTLNIKTENTGLSKNSDNELEINLSADSLNNTPAGNIISHTVQGALNELDGDKISNDGTGNCYLGKLKMIESDWNQWSLDGDIIYSRQPAMFFWGRHHTEGWEALSVIEVGYSGYFGTIAFVL